MTYDSWRTAPGPQYDPVGLLQYVFEAFYQQQCDVCDELAAIGVETEIDGRYSNTEYFCDRHKPDSCK